MRPRRRHRPTSSPTTPLDDDDLLAEFLLRLPPRPCSLPRAASVSKSWRRVATDPHFLRRFRARHGTPPLLGFFDSSSIFYPTLTLKPPDRVPSARLSGYWVIIATRDGLVLCSRGSKLQVLDLLTGDRSSTISTIELPVTLKFELAIDSTSLDRLRFHLIALSTDASYTRLSASVYSYDSGAWTHSMNTLVLRWTVGFMQSPSTLAGNAFYWIHANVKLLRYDLRTRALDIIDVPWNEERSYGYDYRVPWNEERSYEYDCRYLFTTKDGLLCAVMLHEYEHTIQFWVWDTTFSGDAKWVLRRTIQLDTPLPLQLRLYWPKLRIVRFEQDNNVIFLWTDAGIFMFNLETMRCRKVSEETCYDKVYPYSGFMTAGTVLQAGSFLIQRHDALSKGFLV